MIRLHLLGPNQTLLVIQDARETAEIFFSYETPVAAFVPGRGFIRTETKHSVTTSQHINKWLNGVSVGENAAGLL
jgi:hypothetical protein